MDEFRVYAPGNVLEITPSVTPYFGNNPGFRIYSVAQDTFKPADYTSFNYDLATNPPQFNRYYAFSETYPLPDTLNASVEQLASELATNKGKQASYRDHYFSGHHYSIPAAGTFNQITDADWPVYYCGSAKVEQQAFIDCMKSY
jgi:hypothetical protein